MFLLYIAGPFRAGTLSQDENIRRAEDMAEAILAADLDVFPVVPHTLGIRFGVNRPDDAFWLAGTLALMEVCHGVLMVPGWEASAGATAERERARALGLPVFYAVEEVRVWMTAPVASWVLATPVVWEWRDKDGTILADVWATDAAVRWGIGWTAYTGDGDVSGPETGEAGKLAAERAYRAWLNKEDDR